MTATTTSSHLRDVLGHFATGVAIVTTTTPSGPAGLTVNSLTSVSLDPPLVLFCARRGSVTAAAIAQSRVFAANILGRDQEWLSRRFCGDHSTDRFASLAVRPGRTGSPILPEALAYLDCELAEIWDGGDHLVHLGRLVELDRLRDAEPLVFFRGRYR